MGGSQRITRGQRHSCGCCARHTMRHAGAGARHPNCLPTQATVLQPASKPRCSPRSQRVWPGPRCGRTPPRSAGCAPQRRGAATTRAPPCARRRRRREAGGGWAVGCAGGGAQESSWAAGIQGAGFCTQHCYMCRSAPQATSGEPAAGRAPGAAAACGQRCGAGALHLQAAPGGGICSCTGGKGRHVHASKHSHCQGQPGAVWRQGAQAAAGGRRRRPAERWGAASSSSEARRAAMAPNRRLMSGGPPGERAGGRSDFRRGGRGV